MGGWIFLLIVLDIAILALLVLWLVSHFRGGQPTSAVAMLERCQELHDSLKLLVRRAEQVSADVASDTQRGRNLVDEVIKKLQREKDEARLLIDESQRLLVLSEQKLAVAQSYEPSERKYEEALELHRQGISREEILRRVDIADGELELVLSLRNSL